MSTEAKNSRKVEVNGRRYSWPERPVVVVCIDGSEPDYADSDGGGYIEQAMVAGLMPFVSRMMAIGTRRLADSAIPSFTNPNNISIITGAPPSVHGICGNYFLDPETKSEVMMNDPKFLRAATIPSSFSAAGARVAVVTAKDKLRTLLGEGLECGSSGTVCFSAERADETTLAEHGVENGLDFVGLPLPSVYSADLSEFVLSAGVRLMETRCPDIMYLSTTDYIQHMHAPGTSEANDFYRMMDGYFEKLDALGATLAITADHGMKTKHDARGQPSVIYLQSLLEGWLGAGRARVILPITDPYVVHHGALGGFVTVYLADEIDVDGLTARLTEVEGIETVLSRAEACARFDLPEDRIGDLIVISSSGKVIGRTPEDHDLSALTKPLRSHGGLSEQRVPFLLNRPIKDVSPDRRLRNFDIFEIALNHVQ